MIVQQCRLSYHKWLFIHYWKLLLLNLLFLIFSLLKWYPFFSSFIYFLSSLEMKVNEGEVCCICFEQACTIQVLDCGHEMCAHCTLALCCHNKPNPTTSSVTAPLCPFCRSSIAKLVVARAKNEVGEPDNALKLRKSRKSRRISDGSSSFKGLSSIGSFSKLSGRGSGRIADSGEWMDKPLHITLDDSHLDRGALNCDRMY